MASPAIRGSHFPLAHFAGDRRTLRNSLLRRLHHGRATCAGQCGALRRASVDRRLFLSTCTKQRSSFSQATVKISFVVNKLYTRKQGQYLAFIYYYTKLNGRDSIGG